MIMKKLFLIILTFFSIMQVSASETPTLYFFMSSTCIYCQMGLSTLNEIYDSYVNDYNIVIFDINVSDNYDLYEYVIDNYYSGNYGVPLFILGSEFIQVGYSDDLENSIYFASQIENYKDILISEILENVDYYEAYSLRYACELNGIEYISDDLYIENDIIEFKNDIEDIEDIENTNITENNVINEEENSFNYYSLIFAVGLIVVFSIAVFKLK